MDELPSYYRFYFLMPSPLKSKWSNQQQSPRECGQVQARTFGLAQCETLELFYSMQFVLSIMPSNMQQVFPGKGYFVSSIGSDQQIT